MEIMNRNILRSLCLTFVVSFCSYTAFGQRDLKLVTDEASSLLEGLSQPSNKVERATLTKEDERTTTISVRFIGFEDKEYKLQLAVLDSRKAVIEAISPMETDLPKSRQADVTLSMENPSNTVAAPAITSKFLRVRVTPKDGSITSLLGEAFGDLNLNATEYLFELNKSWMVTGPGVKLTATLTPYKNATSISPN